MHKLIILQVIQIIQYNGRGVNSASTSNLKRHWLGFYIFRVYKYSQDNIILVGFQVSQTSSWSSSKQLGYQNTDSISLPSAINTILLPALQLFTQTDSSSTIRPFKILMFIIWIIIGSVVFDIICYIWDISDKGLWYWNSVLFLLQELYHGDERVLESGGGKEREKCKA